MTESNANVFGGKMYLDLALGAAERRDFGHALYYSVFAKIFYTAANADTDTLAYCDRLRGVILKGMEVEFLEVVHGNGLVVNDNNFGALFREYSPSFSRYETLARSAGDLFAQLGASPERFAQTISGWIDKVRDASRNAAGARYLTENAEMILEWETWKGDLPVDLEQSY